MESMLREYYFVLHTCNLGSNTKTVVNPFTQAESQVPVDFGLNKKETEALWEIFAAHKVGGPFDGGHLVGPVYGNEWINFHSGFELGGSTPVVSISTFLTVRELSDKVLDLILRIARLGNLALTSQHGKSARIVGRQPNLKERDRWPDAEELSTIADLEDWLQNQIKDERVSEVEEDDHKVYFSE